MPKDQNEIGALWIKNEGTRKEFLSGTVNGEPVVVFKNKFKKPGERTPDYRILKSQQQPKKQTSEPEPEPITDDDVPF